MPHFPHTPEALLGRNDSRNAATTCKGITSTGRACRRALASPKSSPSSRRNSSATAAADGLTVVPSDGDLYCWQHRNQAKQDAIGTQEQTNAQGQSARQAARKKTRLPALQERSSIDTLVQKLGIGQDFTPGQQSHNKHVNNPKPPLKTHTSDFAATAQPGNSVPHGEKSAKRPPPRKSGFWGGLCCMKSEDDDYVEVVRHRKRTSRAQVSQSSASTPVNNSAKAHSTSHPQAQSNENPNNLLSLIPTDLSPQTTSALLAELVKPISPYDEDGYIYIFWLTPSAATPPDLTTARSLLTTPESRPRNGRRISDVFTEFSLDDENRSVGMAGGSAQKTIMLKIGRASNITRRMNEWQRQCGYALNLVRWYPYVPSSTSPQASPQQQGRRKSEAVHKCPHIHRVERLIHLELASKQVARRCSACGKEHREWFEVPASRQGVQDIDRVVKRWIGWAETLQIRS